eukprot:9074384-Pyramimonas_sp.AAC.1
MGSLPGSRVVMREEAVVHSLARTAMMMAVGETTYRKFEMLGQIPGRTRQMKIFGAGRMVTHGGED